MLAQSRKHGPHFCHRSIYRPGIWTSLSVLFIPSILFILSRIRSRPSQRPFDGVDVVDAAGPGAAADLL